MNQKKSPSRGYITVATKRKQFLIGADNLKESILDFNEEAKITLYTEQRFIDDPTLQHHFRYYDKVIATPSDTNREKMWGMANTPYDETFYLDADTEIVHEDVANVFERLEDNDMIWVELQKETRGHFAEWGWGEGPIDHLTHCGGVCLYRSSSQLVRDFMSDWYTYHLEMRNGSVVPEECKHIPKSFLEKGNSEKLSQLSQISVYGFPNYRYGDSGTIINGNVSGFRNVSSIKRILVSTPLIAGNSGSPILNSKSEVVGIAVTGADKMENSNKTENHGVIPIEILDLI